MRQLIGARVQRAIAQPLLAKHHRKGIRRLRRLRRKPLKERPTRRRPRNRARAKLRNEPLTLPRRQQVEPTNRPIRITNRLPRVIPVYSRLRCSMA